MTLSRMLPAFANMHQCHRMAAILLLLVSWLAMPGAVYAQPEEAPAGTPEIVVEEEAVAVETPDTLEILRHEANILWTCIAAFLVFFMQVGFAMLEAGLTRAKNCVNIIMKNVMDFSIGSLAYWAVGFGLMFGVTNGFCGTSDFFVSGINAETGELDHWTYTFWIFQCVFAATAATIVSGAIAERTKFVSYLIFTIAMTAVIYPIAGSWGWGSLLRGDDNLGWVEKLGFIDFAGSTIVHSVGGWAALAGAIVIGPRLGKYNADGTVNPIIGHSMPLAALGTFILWLGWFGFNPGSTTALAGGEMARVAVTTNLSAVAGCISSTLLCWVMFGKPDLSFALNGALAGLVSITCPCYNVSPSSAILIGLIGGVICVLSVLMFDKLRIDDPVGAITVHGVCGLWGTLAAGFFAQNLFGGGGDGLFFGGGIGILKTQAIVAAAYFAWAFSTALIVFLILKYTIGVRVSAEEEMAGLDIPEHGMSAYPYFQSTEST